MNTFQMGHCEDCSWLKPENKKLKQLLTRAAPHVRARWAELLYQIDPEITQNDMLRNCLEKELDMIQDLALKIEEIL